MNVEKLAKARCNLLTSLIAFSVIPAVFASDRDFHDLSAAGGIASPASTTAPFQNPAGLSRIYRTEITLMDSYYDDSFKNPLLEGGLYYGNGNIGAGVGVAKPTVSGGATSAYFGFGFQIPGIGTSIGVSGSTFIDGGGTAWNAGAIFGTNERFHLGATVHNFTSNYREYGAGIGYDMSSDFTFAVDATLDYNLDNPWVEPALMLRASNAAMTVGYGFSASSGGSTVGSSQIADGFSAGVSYKMNPTIDLQAYYRQLNRYFFGISIGF